MYPYTYLSAGFSAISGISLAYMPAHRYRNTSRSPVKSVCLSVCETRVKRLYVHLADLGSPVCKSVRSGYTHTRISASVFVLLFLCLYRLCNYTFQVGHALGTVPLPYF